MKQTIKLEIDATEEERQDLISEANYEKYKGILTDSECEAKIASINRQFNIIMYSLSGTLVR